MLGYTLAELEIWKGGFTAEGSEQRREAPICLPHEVLEKIFTVIFQLPGWAVVAPSYFALHCHYSLPDSGFRAIRDRLHDSRHGLIPFQLSVQKND